MRGHRWTTFLWVWRNRGGGFNARGPHSSRNAFSISALVGRGQFEDLDSYARHKRSSTHCEFACLTAEDKFGNWCFPASCFQAAVAMSLSQGRGRSVGWSVVVGRGPRLKANTSICHNIFPRSSGSKGISSNKPIPFLKDDVAGMARDTP